jgi:hypothetical protein
VTNAEGRSGQHADHYKRNVECRECHNTVIDANRNIIDPELHINGYHEIEFYQGGTYDAAEKTCSVNAACHPNVRSWLKGQQNAQ